MKSSNETTFWESLRIQKRVLHALLLRELITRYGRKNIGFLWLFVEPMMVTLFMVLAWKEMRASQVSSLNIIAFVMTGYPLLMMWRGAVGQAMSAISANHALLYHRNVRVLDTINARVLLEVAGGTIAQVMLLLFLIALKWIEPPADIFYMLIAWTLMVWFGFALGWVLCVLNYHYEVVGKVWRATGLIMLGASGTLFFVYALHPKIQNILLWFPMIHGTEMFRHGYFGDSVMTLENVFYLVVCNLVLTFAGLLMVRDLSKRIEL